MKKIILSVLFLSSYIFLPAQNFSCREVKSFSNMPDYVLQTRFSPYGNYIAITLGNNTVELYDKTFKKIWSNQGNPKSVAGQVAFSSDEKYLAFTKHKTNHDIGILRLVDLKIIQTLSEQSDHMNEVSFSPDGKFLAASSDDYSIHIWKWENDQFKENYQLVKHVNQANALSFSPDGQILASGFQDGTVKIFQLKNDKYQEIQNIPGNKYSVEALTFHPSGKFFATGGSDFAIRIYNREGSLFKAAKEYKDDWGTVYTIAFSPDGKYMAASKSNGDIMIRKEEGSEWKEENTISRHSSHCFDVDFSSNGKLMSSSGHEGTAVIWEVEGIGYSAKSFVQNNLSSSLTSAQRKIVGSSSEKILSRVDKSLSAPKDEFETNAQFEKRKERLKAHILFLLQQETELYFQATSSKDKATIYVKPERLEFYDADKEMYTFYFLESRAKVSLPVDEAKSLKENFQKAKISIGKTLSKDGISYTYRDFTLIHPVSGKTYQIIPEENPFHYEAKLGSNENNSERTGSDDVSDPAQFDKMNIPGVNYALLFATNDYDQYPDLINPVNDARAIRKELKDHYGFECELVENPSMEQILSKLKEYAQKKYNPKDQLFIFFAGHGKYDEIFKEGYLVMKESKLDDETRTTLLSHSNLRTIINNIPSEHIFLIMDVCFGGTFDPLIASRGADVYTNITKTEFIERKLALKTRLYLTSGGKEYVPDGRPGEHSPFARKFLEALRSYGGEDGILTTAEIILYVEKVIPQPRTGEFGNNEPGSDFIFVAR
jgi:WD40 repeat protein